MTTYVFGPESATENTPQHEHDCKNCKFLGRLGDADLYSCSKDTSTCYILRRSSDGPDYTSTTDFANSTQAMMRINVIGGDDLFYSRLTAVSMLAVGITNLIR